MDFFHADLFLLTLPSLKFLGEVAVSALALFIAAQFLEGVQLKDLTTAAMVALVVALLNVALINYLADDYGISVTGILNFVVDAVVIMLASVFFKGFKVRGLIWAVALAVVMTLLSGFLYKLLEHLEI